MKAKSLITGKIESIPTKAEAKKIRNKKARQKRADRERARREEAQGAKRKANTEKRAEKDRFSTSATLQKSSKELLRGIMKERKIEVKNGKVFSALLKAKLGKQFSRETRADRHRVLAVGCAAYHELATQRNPKEALYRLARSVGVEVNRIGDPCRIIVECLVDYGAKARSGDRQYAARDARALSYVVRVEMTPQQVMNPARGENITVWAKREADHRSQRKSALKSRRRPVEVTARVDAPPNQLPAVSLPQAAYRAIESMADRGVVVLKPRGEGNLLALTITPLPGFTAKSAVRKPSKVRTAIRNTLSKS